MVQITEKIKEFINKDKSPITAKDAVQLLLIGKVETPEERYKNFISQVNNDIERLAKQFQKRHLVVLIPEDLQEKSKDLKTEFTERFFTATLVTSKHTFLILEW